MTREPVPGDRVRFRDGGARRIGTVRRCITAGREGRTGLMRLRRRAQIAFEAAGQRWETFRDVEQIDLVTPEEQLSLLDSEGVSA